MGRQVAENTVSVTKNVDGLLVTYEGAMVRSPDDLLREAEVDLERWEVYDSGVKQWPTTFKLEAKVGKDGKQIGENRAVQVQNHMSWVKLKPRQEFIDALDIAERLSEIMRKHSPRYRPAHRPLETGDGKVLALVDLFDLHVGMLAQAAETGDANWDSKLLKEEVMTAVEWLLQMGAGLDIGRFLVIVGNDLLHADTPENTTTKGTRQDVDTRPFKMYETAYMLMVWVIDRLREIADVDVEVVPGNHDRENSLKMGLTLKAHYRQDVNVHVNATPQLRAKYIWGSNFIGMTHGSEEKLNELPMIFMAENPRLWGEAKHRHILTGHLHRRARKKIPAIETGMHIADVLGTFNGVTVEVVPSLVPPEAWHAAKGYVGGGRAAEIRFYHADRGPMGYFEYRVEVEDAHD